MKHGFLLWFFFFLDVYPRENKVDGFNINNLESLEQDKFFNEGPWAQIIHPIRLKRWAKRELKVTTQHSIIGGEKVYEGEVPYQLSFLFKHNHICGGVIYSETIALTTAHCLNRSLIPSDYSIRAGAHNLIHFSSHEQRVNVEKIVIHRNYNNVTLQNDIALLFLNPPLKFNDWVNKVKVLENHPTDFAGWNAWVSGWGHTESQGKLSIILQEVELYVLAREVCQEKYGQNIFDTNICAGSLARRNTCRGDSGGPLVIRDYQVEGKKQHVLIGLVSWGHANCEEEGFPGVYTKVNQFVDWIKLQTKGPLECRQEKHRPQLHWSVLKNWASAPNGMIYYDGEFHLYWQTDPYSLNNGLKHWGHSVSPDMLTWTDLPLALYPDDLGDILCGSAVLDVKNSSGFQEDPQVPPIVTIFTHGGASQQQSIAYSLNRGRDYTKFKGNPVIPNPGGLPDFRDPKVIRYDENTWVLVLASGQQVSFYSSSDLKNWKHLSNFGADPPQGSHESVWECPDLLRLEEESTFNYHWVLIVSLKNGGPNGIPYGGSGTQYFVGNFDGKVFTSNQIDPLWIDQGKDNYAGVTFSNDPKGRTIFMGWMINLAYYSNIATGDYRGQMTLPRQLSLVNLGQKGSTKLRLCSKMVEELKGLRIPNKFIEINESREIAPDAVLKLSEEGGLLTPLAEIDLTVDIGGLKGISSLAICLVNGVGQEVCTGLDHWREPTKKLFLNRELTGNLAKISQSFTPRLVAGREVGVSDRIISFKIILDWSAVEVFIDGGLTTMNCLFYPQELLDRIEIRHHASTHESRLTLVSAKINALKSIYDC